MDVAEMKAALKAGHDRFKARSGRVYRLDPAQECVIHLTDKKSALLIGFPEKPHPRKRGRAWQWLSIEELEKA